MTKSTTRTTTTHLTTFSRPNNVTYDLTNPTYTTIHLPPSSPWTSSLHWHETHTEYLQVIQGKIQVTLNNTTHIHSADDGIITIPRYALHEWRRVHSTNSNAEDEEEEEEVIVREWTDPADNLKEIFFRNLNSVLLEEQQQQPQPQPQPHYHQYLPQFTKTYWDEVLMTIQLFMIFRDLDNWPVLLTMSHHHHQHDNNSWWLPSSSSSSLTLTRWYTYFWLWVADVIGRRILGLKSRYSEYTR